MEAWLKPIIQDGPNGRHGANNKELQPTPTEVVNFRAKQAENVCLKLSKGIGILISYCCFNPPLFPGGIKM